MMLLTFLICAATQVPCIEANALRHYQCAPLGSAIAVDIYGHMVDDCPKANELNQIIGFYGLPPGEYRLVYEHIK